jgi:ribosomal-protein-serine acetyltransferase
VTTPILGIRVDDDIDLCLHQERRAEALFRLTDANREHLRRWLPWVDQTNSPEDTKRYVRQMLHDLAEGKEYGFEIRFRGKLVGGIGLKVIRDVQEAEIGYWLAEGAQGRGIVTRASRALVRFAFDELGMHRVIIKCAKENARSRAVPERLGFMLEATFREREIAPGLGRQDELVFGLLRSEWTG